MTRHLLPIALFLAVSTLARADETTPLLVADDAATLRERVTVLETKLDDAKEITASLVAEIRDLRWNLAQLKASTAVTGARVEQLETSQGDTDARVRDLTSDVAGMHKQLDGLVTSLQPLALKGLVTQDQLVELRAGLANADHNDATSRARVSNFLRVTGERLAKLEQDRTTDQGKLADAARQFEGVRKDVDGLKDEGYFGKAIRLLSAVSPIIVAAVM